MNPRKAPSLAAMAATVLALCFAFNMLGRGIGDSYTVFLLPLGAEFRWNRSQLSSVYSIYLLVTGLAGPLTGWAFEKHGPRFVYAMGLASLGAGYLLASRLEHLWQFYLCVGVLGGIGVSALGMIPAASLIRRWFGGNMTTAIAIAYAGFGSGTLVVVPLSQHFIEMLGWRETYRLLGAVPLAVLPLAALFLPWRGIAAGDPHSPVNRPHVAAGAPKLRSLASVVRTREYWALVQVFSFTALATFTIVVQAVAYLVDIGFPPIEAATAFGLAGFLSVIGMITSGWLSDRIGYKKTATLSFVLTFLGVAMLLAMLARPTRWALVSFVVFYGLAQGARGPIVASLAAKLFPGPGFSTVYGTIFATMSVGSALGSLVSGLLHDATGGYAASFAFSMACLLVAVAPFWTSDVLARMRR